MGYTCGRWKGSNHAWSRRSGLFDRTGNLRRREPHSTRPIERPTAKICSGRRISHVGFWSLWATELDQVRKYINKDLPERLADCEIDFDRSRPKESESKRCEHGHVYSGKECRSCERERPYRESGQEIPVCPSCQTDQIYEVNSGSCGCHRCGHDYKMLARDYFAPVNMAKAS